MALVEDVTFAILSYEKNASWVDWRGFVVGVICCTKASSETRDGSVFREIGWFL